MEEWRTVSWCENYEVSNLGNVRNRWNNNLMVPHKSNKGYYRLDLCKNNCHKRFSVHRLVAIAFIENPHNLPIVDHIDRNPVNNRSDNLRWCTSNQNNANSSKRSAATSRFKGVSSDGKRWRALIRGNGKDVHIGMFATEKEAAEAYNKAAIELHGEFAVLNDLTPKPKIKVVIAKKETS